MAASNATARFQPRSIGSLGLEQNDVRTQGFYLQKALFGRSSATDDFQLACLLQPGDQRLAHRSVLINY